MVECKHEEKFLSACVGCDLVDGFHEFVACVECGQDVNGEEN
jgi:hypothetical protein